MTTINARQELRLLAERFDWERETPESGTYHFGDTDIYWSTRAEPTVRMKVFYNVKDRIDGARVDVHTGQVTDYGIKLWKLIYFPRYDKRQQLAKIMRAGNPEHAARELEREQEREKMMRQA
jgi:hypothetical protein